MKVWYSWHTVASSPAIQLQWLREDSFLWTHSGSNWPFTPSTQTCCPPSSQKASSHMFSGSTVDEVRDDFNCMTESTENWILLGSARWARSVVVALTAVITCWYFWKRCWMSVMFTCSSDAAERTSDCSELLGRTKRWAWNHRAAAQPPRDYWEIMFFVRHLTSNTTSANVPIGERKVSAYYSVMVVYLCVG